MLFIYYFGVASSISCLIRWVEYIIIHDFVASSMQSFERQIFAEFNI